MADPDWLQTGSFDRGFAQVDNLYAGQAQRQAGRAVARGDYQAGAGALLNRGDLQGGLALQATGREQEAARRAREAEAEKEQIDFTVRTAGALKGVLAQGGDVLAEFDRMIPVFQQLGTTPEQVAQLRAGLAADPNGFLSGVQKFASQKEQEYRYEKVGSDLYVFDGNSANPVRRFEARQEPVSVGGVLYNPANNQVILDTREPRYQTVQNSDGSSSLVAIDQPAPVTGGAPSSGSVASDLNVPALIGDILPGARLTSGLREPDQNRTAGGSPRSYHLSGQAIDFVPPPGTDINQLRATLEGQGVQIAELIDEGDHWHLAWRGGTQAPNIGRGEQVQGRTPRAAGGGVRVVAQGANNGLTPAQQRAEAREGRQERQDQRQLRRDFEGDPVVKNFKDVEASYLQVVQLTGPNANAADDIAATFSFMRMLDPGSVVREGEFALVGRAQGVTGQALVALQRLDSGQSLTPQLRRSLRESAANVLAARRIPYDQRVQQYRGWAEEDGYDPDRVAPLAPSGDGSRRRDRPPFEMNPDQRRTAATIARTRPGGIQGEHPRGSRYHPLYLNPADPEGSFGNVRAGQWYIGPDGQLRQKPGGR